MAGSDEDCDWLIDEIGKKFETKKTGQLSLGQVGSKPRVHNPPPPKVIFLKTFPGAQKNCPTKNLWRLQPKIIFCQVPGPSNPTNHGLLQPKNTVDGRNPFAPPFKNHGRMRFPCKYQQTMVSTTVLIWCRILSIHSMVGDFPFV